MEEHNLRLEKVMARLNERRVQLNLEKCQFRAVEIEWLGHKITNSGITPSSAKVSAVQAFRQPMNESEIRSFFGACELFK